MTYNVNLADQIREYMLQIPDLDIEEKTMFGGLAFMIKGKMCINVSGENLMCRFDPALTSKLAERTGLQP